MEYSFIILVVDWVIRIVTVPIIAYRFRPPAALAWIAIVSFEPIFGFVLFLIFGENRLPKKRIAAHALRRKKMQIDLLPAIRPFICLPLAADEQGSSRLLTTQLGEMPAVSGNQFELIDETDAVIDRLIQDINQAKHHVHLLFYIWRDDPTGHRVIEAVRQAHQRGVLCRILVDAVGSGTFLRKHQHQLRAAGIEIHPILPVNLFRKRLSRFDMRNHRKLVVIDGFTAYTGSQNICDADYGTRKISWHDVMLRLQGPIVLQLQTVFCTDWYAETKQQLDFQDYFPKPVTAGPRTIELFPSGPTYPTRNLHHLLVSSIHLARKEILITTPYFIPDDSLLQAIQIARMRGVKVILVLSERSDQILVSAAQKSFYEELFEIGVEIHLYQPGLLHSKTLSIDRRFAMIGTSNMDIRSFALNLELNLILFDEVSVADTLMLQHKYLQQSRTLTQSQWQAVGRWKNTVYSLARLLAPLL